jgi:hypothetical protein
VSTFVQSLADVIDDLFRLYDLAVIFAHLPPVRPDQDHVDQVADRAVRAFLPEHLEAGERSININRGTGQEVPALFVRSLLLRVFVQLGGTVMIETIATFQPRSAPSPTATFVNFAVSIRQGPGHEV